jgi:superfamily II DNA/RNA helicase
LRAGSNHAPGGAAEGTNNLVGASVCLRSWPAASSIGHMTRRPLSAKSAAVETCRRRFTHSQATHQVTFIQTDPALARALADRNYTSPTPVQSAVLASETQDGDILVSAQTGSGKTIAYGLAIASTVLGDAERAADAREPVALIVAPTRELALQVERELAWLYKYASARIVACVGGMDARLERRKLSEGAQIVVGTPGSPARSHRARRVDHERSHRGRSRRSGRNA